MLPGLEHLVHARDARRKALAQPVAHHVALVAQVVVLPVQKPALDHFDVGALHDGILFQLVMRLLGALGFGQVVVHVHHQPAAALGLPVFGVHVVPVGIADGVAAVEHHGMVLVAAFVLGIGKLRHVVAVVRKQGKGVCLLRLRPVRPLPDTKQHLPRVRVQHEPPAQFEGFQRGIETVGDGVVLPGHIHLGRGKGSCVRLDGV